MRGSETCNSFIESLLNRVKQRSMQSPMSALLKKHILGVYLSALIYNKSATLLYFEHNGITAQLLSELVSTQKKMKHNLMSLKMRATTSTAILMTQTMRT